MFCRRQMWRCIKLVTFSTPSLLTPFTDNKWVKSQYVQLLVKREILRRKVFSTFTNGILPLLWLQSTPLQTCQAKIPFTKGTLFIRLSSACRCKRLIYFEIYALITFTYVSVAAHRQTKQKIPIKSFTLLRDLGWQNYIPEEMQRNEH